MLAVHGMLYPWIGDEVRIEPDFEKRRLCGKFYAEGRIRSCVVLYHILCVVLDKKTWTLIRRLKKEGVDRLARKSNNINFVMESLLKGANTLMSTKTVVGEATKIDDTIIIPLVDVTFGVGAGASRSDKKDGGAGGLSGKMTPSAVLLIKNGQTKLVNIKNQDSVTKILDMIPGIRRKTCSLRNRRR